MGFWNPIIRFFFFLPRPNIYFLPQKDDACSWLKNAQLDFSGALLPKVSRRLIMWRWCGWWSLSLEVKSERACACLVSDFQEAEHNCTRLANERPDLTSLLACPLITDPVMLCSFRIEASILWPAWSEGSCFTRFICSDEIWSCRRFGDVPAFSSAPSLQQLWLCFHMESKVLVAVVRLLYSVSVLR